MIGYLKLILDNLRAILAKLGGGGIDPSIAKNLQRIADNSDKTVALLETLAGTTVAADDLALDGSVDAPVKQ